MVILAVRFCRSSQLCRILSKGQIELVNICFVFTVASNFLFHICLQFHSLLQNITNCQQRFYFRFLSKMMHSGHYQPARAFSFFGSTLTLWWVKVEPKKPDALTRQDIIDDVLLSKKVIVLPEATLVFPKFNQLPNRIPPVLNVDFSMPDLSN